MSYKYQMHTHTYPCSGCGKISPEELVDALKSAGFDGCVITDHFHNGNSGIDRSLDWADFVRQYENAFLRAKKHGEKLGFDVFFGIEEGVGDGMEILCYGLTPDVLYTHPELREKNLELWYKVMKANGVLCIQSHPYRDREYIPEAKILPDDLIDGIEVCNSTNYTEENIRAEEAVKNRPDFILTSGSDVHRVEDVANTGILTERRIKDEKDLAEILKSGEYTLLYNYK